MASKSNSSLITILPTFEGNENQCINYYIQQIEDVATLEKWDDTKKLLILRLNLKGKALEIYNSDQYMSKSNTFDELAKSLKSKFQKNLSFDVLQQQFSNIKLQPNQTVKSLADLIDSKANAYLNITSTSTADAKDLAEKIKLQKLIESVTPEIRFELKKLAPKTFSQAISIAKNIQNAINEENFNSNKMSQIEINTLIQNQIETNNKISLLQKQIEENKTPAIPSTSNVNNLFKNPAEYSNQYERRNRTFQRHPRVNAYNANRQNCLICGKPHLTIDCWYFPHSFRNNSRNNSRPYPSRNFRYTRNNRSRPARTNNFRNLNQ